jgi:hypothetical protein
MPLGRHNAAAAAHMEWYTRTGLGLEPLTAAAVPAHAEVFDIVGAPELRGKQQFQVIVGRKNADLDTDGGREYLFDTRKKL